MRVCTSCNKSLPNSQFYKKGDRLESVCKECKKKKRKATYVAKRNIDDSKPIISLVMMMLDSELASLTSYDNQLNLLINNIVRKKRSR